MDVSEFSDDYLLANVAETGRLLVWANDPLTEMSLGDWHKELRAEAVRRGLLDAEERVSDAKEQEGQ